MATEAEKEIVQQILQANAQKWPGAYFLKDK
jgi:hypothetical protein